MKTILIYNIDDYPENGGGIVYEELKGDNYILNRINELADKHGAYFEFITAGSLHDIEVEKQEIVTKYKIK